MKNFNLSNIMKKAWELVKNFGYTMSMALKTAWANAKKIASFIKELPEEAHTWYAWTLLGREVRHDEKCVGQVVVANPKRKSGFETLSYFLASQTVELGSQPAKER